MLLDTYFYHLPMQYLHILVKILFNFGKSLNPEEAKTVLVKICCLIKKKKIIRKKLEIQKLND